MTRLFLPALSALAILSLGDGASAQDTSDGWQMTCGAENCSILRTAVDPATDRTVATLITIVGQNEETRIGAALPLGLALEPGIRMIAGETVIEVPFQVCFPDGCRALKAVTEAEFAALSQAETISLRFFAMGSSTQVSVELPMDGFVEQVALARETMAAQ